MWEVFKPTTGYVIYRTRFHLVAKLVARLLHSHFNSGLDYAKEGEGWN